MLNFNLCYHKDCRKKVEYVAKDGMGYCSKHSIMIIEKYGMNEFWPHYYSAILNDYDSYIRRNKEEETRRLAEKIARRLDKDSTYYRSKKIRKK